MGERDGEGKWDWDRGLVRWGSTMIEDAWHELGLEWREAGTL